MNDEVQYIIIGANGKQYGPMNMEVLKSLLRDDRVEAATQIWDSTTQAWHQAQQIEELSEFFPEETAEEPLATGAEEPAEPYVSTLALASMWCGIVAVPTFCCMGWILALLAVILGFIGRHEVKRYGSEGAIYANVGIVCGLLAMGLTAILLLVFRQPVFDVLKKLVEQASGT